MEFQVEGYHIVGAGIAAIVSTWCEQAAVMTTWLCLSLMIESQNQTAHYLLQQGLEAASIQALQLTNEQTVTWSRAISAKFFLKRWSPRRCCGDTL